MVGLSASQIFSSLLPTHFNGGRYHNIITFHCIVFSGNSSDAVQLSVLESRNTSVFQENKNCIFTPDIPERSFITQEERTGLLGTEIHQKKSQTACMSYVVRWLIYPWCLPKTQYWVMEPCCQRWLIFLPRGWILRAENIFFPSITWVASISQYRQ